MRSLEYRDLTIDILTNKLDINVEEARELCDKYKEIIEQAAENMTPEYGPGWAARRIMEREEE